MKRDKRKFTRADYNTHVRLKRPKIAFQGTAIIPDITKDISAGGVRLALYESLEISEIIELEFSLIESKTITVKGLVKWIDKIKTGKDDKTTVGYYVGVEFLNITREDRDFINKFVSRLKRP